MGDYTSEEEIFEVDHIAGRRVTPNGVIEYLIRWKGFDSTDDTWEPKDNLNDCKEVITNYIRSLKTADLSPPQTRRRSNRVVTDDRPTKDYTKVKLRKHQVIALHLKYPPPVSPSNVTSEREERLEQKDEPVEEDKQKPTKIKARSKAVEVFAILVVILFLVILFLSMVEPVK